MDDYVALAFIAAFVLCGIGLLVALWFEYRAYKEMIKHAKTLMDWFFEGRNK